MRLRALIPAGLFLIFATLFLIAVFRGDPSRVPSALIGRYVPTFSLPPVEGLGLPGLSDADFGKGEPVIVNVWASWCVPCREEHSVLTELKGLTTSPIYGINYKDAPDAARRFLGELGNPFTRVGADAKGRTSIDWGVYGVPETYIVDGKGRIAYKHVGPLTPKIVDAEILPALRAATAR
ncbi:MAG: DsbE family thiol:disulfide interchange protein [Parvibaculum sp.]|uniref:DsbE family thiol:disulfide interchange protein n=1 Tax=Parvibaculum sp. TaxID=2024848 RepID=UPI003C727BA7